MIYPKISTMAMLVCPAVLVGLTLGCTYPPKTQQEPTQQTYDIEVMPLQSNEYIFAQFGCGNERCEREEFSQNAKQVYLLRVMEAGDEFDIPWIKGTTIKESILRWARLQDQNDRAGSAKVGKVMGLVAALFPAVITVVALLFILMILIRIRT